MMTDDSKAGDMAVERPVPDPLAGETRQERQTVRRQSIVEAVMAEGALRIDELTDRFAISLMTAHRDLDDLVSRGLLRKGRGVVSAATTSSGEHSDVYRSSRQSAQKTAIAHAAMSFVEPGQAVFLDDSTTVFQMVPLLSQRLPLTVITNSLTLMHELKAMRDLTLLGLGGQYHAWCNAFMGPATTGEISRLRADVLILSMAAITDDVVCHHSPEMIETKRAMFSSASARILLMDHTKFERRAQHEFAPLGDFDVVIVDDGTPKLHIERMRERKIKVVVAPVKAQ